MININDHSPELVKEWDPIKNGARTPFNTAYGSDYEIFWICSVCGNEWKVRAANRTVQKTGCPVCKKRLNHSFPELALFFYLKKIFTDVRLDEQMKILPYKTVDLFIPSLKFAIEYDGEHTHRNKGEKDEEKSQLILEKGYSLLRIREEGLPEFTFTHPHLTIISYKRIGEPTVDNFIKEVLRFFKIDNETMKSINVLKDTISILKQLPPVTQKNNLEELFPELAREWHFERNHPFGPEHFKAKSNYKVWWKCGNGHEYDTKIISRTKGHGCRFCAGIEATEERSLANLFPSLALEWDHVRNGEVTPNTISAHSSKRVFWKCPDCTSSYDKVVNERTGRGENCPYCAGKRINHTNSLFSLRPDLAKLWHPTENTKRPDKVSLGAHYKATWICENGHSPYKAYVYSRVEGRGCVKCYEEMGRFQLHKVPYEKSVAKKKVFLLSQWDYEKNEVSPNETGAYARQMVWWKCSNGCSWQQEPNARNSSRCKICRVKD